jgi:ferredoxin
MFNVPVGIAIDQQDRVYVADTHNCRVQVFDRDGVFLRAWGECGDLDGQLNCPQGIAISPAGDVFVADTFNNRIQQFTADGEWIATMGCAADFWLPCGIAFDPWGAMCVADTMNNRVVFFTGAKISPPAIKTFTGNETRAPVGLAEEIRSLAENMGACHFGFADMTRAWRESPASFEESGPLLTGISICVHEDTSLLDNLPRSDFEYRVDHYNAKITLALRIGDCIAELLHARGFKAHRLSHPPKGKPTGLFKLTARFAGLGWIGKNRLLLTPEHGCHIALAAVLTDAPLPVYEGKLMEDRCGDCEKCIDACPVHAYSREPFGEMDSMDGFNTGVCAVFRGVVNPTGWGLCGLCVKACPKGR